MDSPAFRDPETGVNSILPTLYDWYGCQEALSCMCKRPNISKPTIAVAASKLALCG
jgi:hypothetical protein